MAVVKSGGKELGISCKNELKPLTKQEILDEDTYIKSIENIIERDFFPEVTKLKAQNEYLDAVNMQDVDKLRALSSQYNILHTPVGAPPPTPASFERPSTGKHWESIDDDGIQASATPGGNFDQTKEDVLNQQDNKEQTENTTSLDKFFAKNTSEDNASFEIIMENALQKNKEKHAWLYEKEKEHALLAQQRLALTENKEGDQLKLADRPANLDNWEYTNKNALMYVPECSTLTTEEAITQAKLCEREIKHTNTRLPEDVLKEKASENSVTKAVESQVMGLKGKIGVDGKEMGTNETPNVNGFRFVATPSPAPGMDASPLMTWGTIEGTPFRLDAGDITVDSTPGPTFKIPKPKQREVLAHKLAEKASKRHREERRQAVAASAFGKSPRNKNTSERLSGMSPAAQRLASERLGIRLGTDKALRSSYSPSPQHNAQRTPDRSRTPSRTPSSTPGNKTPRTPSLTDNLLNLPKH